MRDHAHFGDIRLSLGSPAAAGFTNPKMPAFNDPKALAGMAHSAVIKELIGYIYIIYIYRYIHIETNDPYPATSNQQPATSHHPTTHHPAPSH